MKTFKLYALYVEDTCLFIGRSQLSDKEWIHGLKNKNHMNREITKYIFNNLDKKYNCKVLYKQKLKWIPIDVLKEFHEKLKPTFKNAQILST